MKSFLIILTLIGLMGCGEEKKPTPPVDVQKISTVPSKKSQFKVNLTWEKGPVADKFSTAKLLFFDKNDASLKGVKMISFVPDMPSHGHGTSMDDQKIVSGKEPNEIRVENVFFVMGGPWVITVTAEINGQTDTAEVSVDVP